jgi:hypothetical protein
MSSPEPFLSRKSPELQSPLTSTERAPSTQLYDFDHEVFVIWRPWESCHRCRTAYEAGTLTPPENGDCVCPHTRMTQYKELLRKRSQGLCEFPTHESTTLKNGVIQISISVATRRTKETAAKADAATPAGPPRPPVL